MNPLYCLKPEISSPFPQEWDAVLADGWKDRVADHGTGLISADACSALQSFGQW